MKNIPNIQALGLDWPELAKIAADIARLDRDLCDTDARLGRLTGELQGARLADREAYAAALLEGKDEPKTSAAAKLDREREELQKRKEALDTALRKLYGEQAAIVREHAAEWQDRILEKLPGTRRRMEQASAAVLAAVEQLNTLASLYNWTVTPELPFRRKPRVGEVFLLGRTVPVSGVLEALLAQAARLGVVREPPAAAASETGEGAEGAA